MHHPKQYNNIGELAKCSIVKPVAATSYNARAHTFCRSTIRSRDITNAQGLRLWRGRPCWRRSGSITKRRKAAASTTMQAAPAVTCMRSRRTAAHARRSARETQRTCQSFRPARHRSFRRISAISMHCRRHGNLPQSDRRTATGGPDASLLSLLASLTVLSALAPSAQAQQAETLRIGMRDDPDILDPTFSRTYVGTVVMTALCDKLFDFDAKLNIVPVLATGYEWADGRTLLIRLRTGRAVPQRREIRRRCGEILAWNATSTPTAASAAARSARWTMSRWSIR